MVPFEVLCYSPQVYMPWTRAALKPRDPGSIQQEPCTLFPLMQCSGIAPQEKYHPFVLVPAHRHLRGSVVGEAILSLRIDWWKDRFAVNLQSSPQGLPDLLCVFARQPPRLRAEADAPAILIVLRRPAEVIPGTLGTDTAQVRTVCLDAFVNSLLQMWIDLEYGFSPPHVSYQPGTASNGHCPQQLQDALPIPLLG